MMILPTSRPVALGVAGLLALAGTGCGGDEEQERLLTSGKADRMLSLLDDAEEQFDAGECEALEETVATLQTEVDQISPDVDPEVREALDTEVADLDSLTSECEAPEPVETVPEETVPPPTEEETTEEETTEEETTEEERPPPDENGGGGGGDGGNQAPSDDGGPQPPPGQDGAAPPGQSGEVPDEDTGEEPQPQEADATPGGGA